MHISKRSFSLNSRNDFRSTIGFILRPIHTEEIYRVELSPFLPEDSTIRVLDSRGHLLMESASGQSGEDFFLEYTVQDVQAGIYYFEVSDGFYYQIKEVRVPAA